MLSTAKLMNIQVLATCKVYICCPCNAERLKEHRQTHAFHSGLVVNASGVSPYQAFWLVVLAEISFDECLKELFK